MIEKITSGKERYLDLLLIADPSEEMLMRYLPESDLYVLKENGQALCVAAMYPLGNGNYELKNIAAHPSFRKKGYGKMMMEHLLEKYADAPAIYVGTGGTGIPGKEFYQLSFYKKCGFSYSHTIRNFFTDNYPEPIIEENGMQCIDMIYLVYHGKKYKTKTETPPSPLHNTEKSG